MSATNTIGENGKCGKQHAFERCLPQNGKRCCSINGFCGYEENYCLRAYGCQYDCEGDEPDLPDGTPDDFPFNATISTKSTSSSLMLTSSTTFLTSTSTNTLLSTSSTNTLEASGTATESPTAQSTAASAQKGLQGAAKTGAIAGGVVGGVALLALLVLLFRCCRRRRGRNNSSRIVTPPAVEEVRSDPRGFHRGPNVQSNARVLDL